MKPDASGLGLCRSPSSFVASHNMIFLHLESPSDKFPTSDQAWVSSAYHKSTIHWLLTKSELNLFHVGYTKIGILGMAGCNGLIMTARARVPILLLANTFMMFEHLDLQNIQY